MIQTGILIVDSNNEQNAITLVPIKQPVQTQEDDFNFIKYKEALECIKQDPHIKLNFD